MEFKFAVFDSTVPASVLNQIAEVYIECFTGPPRFENWSLETVLEELARFVAAGSDFLVATTEAGEVVSFAIGVPMNRYFKEAELVAAGAPSNSYYFAALGTKTAFRKRGLGLTLHKMREELARQREYAAVSVRVRADNEDNLSLLSKMKFQETSRYTSTFAGSSAERLILSKPVQSFVNCRGTES